MRKQFINFKKKQSGLHFLFLLAVSLGMVACNPNYRASSQASTDEMSGGVVNGQKVTGEDPLAKGVVAILSVTSSGEALCTGSLIASDLVLTAAHCVEGTPERLIAIFAHDVSKSREMERREVDAFRQHPSWGRNSKQGKGDIAILHLNQPAPGGYKPVALTDRHFEPTANRATIMFGYGVTSGNSHEGAGVLRKTQTRILKSLSATEVISDGKSSSVCYGDSGGPAFVQIGGRWLVWGVASSVSNQTCDDTAIHTRVDAYLKWIESTAKSLRKS